MSRNLEIKVQCSNEELQLIRSRSEKMGVERFEHLRQVDTYFGVAHGRLKLREIQSETGDSWSELIAYSRADETGSRWSNYQRVPLDPASGGDLKTALSISCGVQVIVSKTRTVGVWRRTRIHLDQLEGLGAFVELETVAGELDRDEEIASEHAAAIKSLELDMLPVIAGSYSDLK